MELYIAPNGDDKARGTLDTPLKTLSAAVRRMAAAEDGYWDGRAEIILRGGVYPVDRTIDIATNMPLTIRACTGEEAVLDVPGVADQSVTAAIRPEGFTLSETGALSCDLSRVEVMGRDISVVSTHPKSQNVTIRSIISAENAVNTTSQKVRFDLKPNKVFLFHKESGARIDFG